MTCSATVYILRHSDHKGNILTLTARAHAEESGRCFARLNLPTPTLVLCSTAMRCITTTDLFVLGIGTAPKAFVPDSRLADWATDPMSGGQEGVTALKAEAASKGIDAEEYLLTAPQFHDRMVERGHEGAEAIVAAMGGRYGNHTTILVGSHGGSRIEVMIAALEGAEDPTTTDLRVGRCSVVMLQFNADLFARYGCRVIKRRYYENLAANDRLTSAPMPTPPREEATIDCGRGCL